MKKVLARTVAVAVFACATVGLSGVSMAEQKLESLKIMAPASPGGGWDQTARSMQQALQEGGLVKTVQVNNVPGAGGTIGLAQFATQGKGDGKQMMVGGMVMIGAIKTNNAPVGIDSVTPIARLTGEYEVLVVPAASEIKTFDDLKKKLKEAPRAVAWAGGSAGGTDHILVGLIGKELGLKPSDVNYVPFSGGGEALAAILGGHVTVGVSGAGEWASQIASGQLRALAVSSAERLKDVNAPTLKESGVNVELANWRGIFAAPGISAKDKETLISAVEAAVKGPVWQDTLVKRGQTDLFQKGDDFAAFLKDDQARIETVLKDIGLVK